MNRFSLALAFGFKKDFIKVAKLLTSNSIIFKILSQNSYANIHA